jgi:Family of unknown function (DUF6476)
MHRNMRLLMAVTIGMGVLILLGTTVVIVTIAHRIAAPRARPEDVISLHLDEPSGTHIGGIAGAGDRLAVVLQGGGTDRILLISPDTGAVTGRITLGR